MPGVAGLQPDQQPAAWDDHVLVYEAAFEPFSLAFAKAAIAALGEIAGLRVLDVAAGTGGAALELARRGAEVLAIDAAPGMVARIKQRADTEGLRLEAEVMDGSRLALPEATYDAGISVFGVILFPQPEIGLRELTRVVRPGGTIAVVTWTDPQSYELATGLRASAEAIAGPITMGTLPAQLRFVDPDRFRELFSAAGLRDVEITKLRSALRAPSSGWLVKHLAFAPGMASLLSSFGSQRDAILQHYLESLNSRFGGGEVVLKGAASLGIAIR
jgi:ubiquinone/menaquinone biosynthesis C-methylase UbiE